METNFRIFLSLPRRSVVFTHCVTAIAEMNYITLHYIFRVIFLWKTVEYCLFVTRFNVISDLMSRFA